MTYHLMMMDEGPEFLMTEIEILEYLDALKDR
jgi:hypothetical protein